MAILAQLGFAKKGKVEKGKCQVFLGNSFDCR